MSGTGGNEFPDFVIDPYAEGSIEVEDLNAPMRLAQDTLFCAGHAFLSDGRLLLVGGQRSSPELGLDYALLFESRRRGEQAWMPVGSEILGGPSWYPTVTRLAGGEMLCISGFVDWGGELNRTVQLFEPRRLAVKRSPWRLLALHGEVPDVSPTGADYTHTFALPRALVRGGRERQAVMVGKSGVVHLFDYRGPTGASSQRFIAQPNARRPAPAASAAPAAGASSAMLADGRILIVGSGDEDGEGEQSLMSTAHIYDPYRDSWRAIDTGIARIYPVAILLPDGTVAVINGDGGPGDPRRPQVIDPESEAVTTGPPWPDAGKRGYHNIALLLPDGRVLCGSGESAAPREPHGPRERTDMRHYSPPYLSVLSEDERPRLTGVPAHIPYRRPATIAFEHGPIHKATLIAPGSMTHSIDMNQRCVVLFEGHADDGEVAVGGPVSPSAAPPGDYMLFVLRRVGSGDDSVLVPSVGRFVRVG